MKGWKILRDCRLKGDGIHHATLGIARKGEAGRARPQERRPARSGADDQGRQGGRVRDRDGMWLE